MRHHSASGYAGFSIICLLFIFCFKGNTQCLTKQNVWDSINGIEKKSDFSSSEKLKHFYILKNISDKCNLDHDSVYARTLLKIGAYEILVNKNYNVGISYINTSLRINTSHKSGSSKYFAAIGYYSLAFNYYKLALLDKSLNYFDSTIAITATFPDTTAFILYSRLYKANIFFQNGDYQKAIEESSLGINYSVKYKDSSSYLEFLNQRAQSLYFENNLTAALNDLEKIIIAAKNKMDLYSLASALKMKAIIFEKKGDFLTANLLFRESISYRTQTGNYQQIALDYTDYGNFYLDSLYDYKNAERCYLKTIFYGKKISDSVVLSKANINIAEIYLRQKDYKTSFDYYLKSLNYLDIHPGKNILQNPSSDQLNAIGAKELAIVIMNNKIEILSGLYSKNQDKENLSGCINTALVMDTLITKMRRIQTGTESKLYWRDYTRGFFTNAIEACYLANNYPLAFYFMEKSRAVLLNDKLNELGATTHLPAYEIATQDNFQIKIVGLQQKIAMLADTSKQFKTLQLQLINTKNDLEQYIRSLEKKYPAYYQYKYADNVPSLKNLQTYLSKNNQSFIHYFSGDSVIYILAITSTQTKFIHLSQKDFSKESLSVFLQLCANKGKLNSHYDSFVALSNSIYKAIFQPLQLPKGRIIICADNIVIPFDALCTDANGKKFLLNDYSFSYVYSARFLMKQFNNPVAKGSFIGFAPVSFAPDLNVADLKNAGNALHTSADYYKSNKLFVHQNASRKNFFNYASSYSIVGIFSHAKADTTGNEPVLFMQDSLIHLSELQLLNNPATKLVLLSACQTNVGKFASGEGIYSLARGFSSAGIPSVAATLWKADEQAIYSISEKFNQYLSEGMNKDEALQKAKLFFIQSNSNNEKLLPYYWANMILIGNTDAINLETTHNNYWWIATSACALILTFIFFFFRKKSRS